MIFCRSSSVFANMISFITPCASSKLWNNRCLILFMMQYSINSFSPFGLNLTNRQVAPRAADKSETPSPKKNTIGAGSIFLYGAIALDLSCPKPLIYHSQSNAQTVMCNVTSQDDGIECPSSHHRRFSPHSILFECRQGWPGTYSGLRG